jgi:arsenate reductase
VRVFSAGSEPRPVHPLAVQAMQEKNIDIRAQRAKGFDAVLPDAVLPDAVFPDAVCKETDASGVTPPGGDAWEPFDYVITVCDRARETCPTFPGHPVSIHWSIPDPAAVQGSEDEQRLAFRAAAEQLAQRIQNFLQREAIAGAEA